MVALNNGGSLRGAWIRLFSDALSFRRLPMPRKGFFMLTIDIEGCADGELDQAISLLCEERERRCRIAAPSEKAGLARANRRDPRCPSCGSRLHKDGIRADGAQSYACPSCGRKSSDSTGTSLSSSKLGVEGIRRVITLICMDCPDWVIADIAGVNIKTAQFWVDRCLDAAVRWSAESRLSGHLWFDEMRFAPTRASGLEAGVWTTYVGKIARDAYMEVAFDGSGGFCKVFYEKLGTPSRDMILGAFAGRVEPGSTATHDGAPCHNLMIKKLGLVDDWHKFIAGDEGYEKAMKLMSNCCSYIRHAFESHPGIKYGKLEAYANFFLYRWMHVRKHGLKLTVDYLISRVFGTPKSHLFDDYGEESEIWSRK